MIQPPAAGSILPHPSGKTGMLPSCLQSPLLCLPMHRRWGKEGTQGCRGDSLCGSATSLLQRGGIRPPSPILTFPGTWLSPGGGYSCWDAAASPLLDHLPHSATVSTDRSSVPPHFSRNYLKTWMPDQGCGASMDHLGFLYSLQAITGGGSAVARFPGEAPAKPL